MEDYILRATMNSTARIFVATTRELVQKAFDIHKTSPVMTAALGRTLTAGSIMGLMLKSEGDLLTINIEGDGLGKGLTVTADEKARVKGYCFENIVDIPLKPNGKLDVSGALGFGTMTVIKDMGLKEPYVGNIPLVSGEIAEDLTYYFAKSEQTPSAVALGVYIDRDYSVKQSGGFIIQMMPDADDETVTYLENKLAEIKPVTELLESGMTPEDILKEICGDYEYSILDRITPEYYCNCSKSKVEKALISIGKNELERIIEEDGKANIHCHFCNKDYDFTKDELTALLAEASK